MLENFIAVILAGGRGTRLWPLTAKRAKPAVPIAGKFRLIDIAISNSLHSGIRKIYIMTQFASESLHRHIHQTYTFPPFSRGFITILAAQQTLDNKGWYQGTADAVRQNLNYLDQKGVEYYLILSGDHLYRMDYREMLQTHNEHNADITVSVYPVDINQAGEFGVLKTDDEGRILDFYEKPKDRHIFDQFSPNQAWLRDNHIEAGGQVLLASMGIYLFSRKALFEILAENTGSDFGREIFPQAIQKYKVVAHPFTGYWEDIGTIRSFYDAMLMLTDENPQFDFFDENRPIYTHARFLPGSRIDRCEIRESLICDAARVTRATIDKCIIGIRSRVSPGVTLRRVVLMGADYFEDEADLQENRRLRRPDVGIGADSVIEEAIIDKNARIGRNVSMVSSGRPREATHSNYAIRDGILIVPKSAVIPDGFVMPGS